jgi:hypothetical protein
VLAPTFTASTRRCTTYLSGFGINAFLCASAPLRENFFNRPIAAGSAGIRNEIVINRFQKLPSPHANPPFGLVA